MPEATAAPHPRRRRRAGEDARRRVLAAAYEIVSERGYDGTTLALITERSGLKPGSVYWQFTGKEEIMAAVVDHSYAEWLEAILRIDDRFATEMPRCQAALSAPDLATRIDAAVTRAFYQLRRGMIDQPAFWQLGITLALVPKAITIPARDRYQVAREHNESRIAARWVQIIDPGTDPTAPPEDLQQEANRIARVWRAHADGLLILTHTVGLDAIDELAEPMHAAMAAAATRILAHRL
ncbi:TetR/AcrR family transcriptional regulator [Nocardia higoensis]|uniref:TetR/AcrR family transcriptional regulator n=1 Tax=Nocardia higoensis TaxID=228599 RepID=UPI0003167C39|nr:helix-turn-helix domain-containing protein [Nocardia higoensis]